MHIPESLSSLRRKLTEDARRAATGFSEDIEDANAVLLDPFSSDAEKDAAMREWLKDHQSQPCVFGKLAGSRKNMDFCFITAQDINQGDEHVAAKIAEARRFWKQRAFVGMPKHGFMLIVCDGAVAKAAPDEALYRFSLRVQELAGWPASPAQRQNDLVQEWLYLRSPDGSRIAKFTFSVDFFAAAADRRWWHDHRTPGGIAFTANSLGHMARHQEWYELRGERVEWALRQAMNTINSAATEHPFCPATYLLNLTDGKPVREFNWPGPKPLPSSKDLDGKDCGTYRGHLHTDHAIRIEFFRDADEPKHYRNPYNMDFTYIFDTEEADNLIFMVGDDATVAEVEADLGPIGELQAIGATIPEMLPGRPAVAADRINAALDRLRGRAMSEQEIERLLD